MFKKIVINAIKILIVALVCWGLVCLYREKIYYKPEAVANRIEKASKRQYESKLDDAKSLAAHEGVVVILDAFGGGNEQGLKYEQALEKDITIAIAKEAQRLLEEKDITVFLTRDGDFGLSERQRVSLRDATQADYCIRITVSEGEENQTGVLVRYSSSYYDNKLTNAEFAAILEQNICDRAQTNACGIVDVCAEDSGEKVQWLEHTQRPCAIVSVGYISNDTERNALVNSAYQKKLAEGIEKAILACVEE